MKKLIKPTQAFIIITVIIAIVYFIGRAGALETDTITIQSYVIGSVVSMIYIAVMVIISKVLGGLNDN